MIAQTIPIKVGENGAAALHQSQKSRTSLLAAICLQFRVKSILRAKVF